VLIRRSVEFLIKDFEDSADSQRIGLFHFRHPPPLLAKSGGGERRFMAL